jgi:hypothetical protein
MVAKLISTAVAMASLDGREPTKIRTRPVGQQLPRYKLISTAVAMASLDGREPTKIRTRPVGQQLPRYMRQGAGPRSAHAQLVSNCRDTCAREQAGQYHGFTQLLGLTIGDRYYAQRDESTPYCICHIL